MMELLPMASDRVVGIKIDGTIRKADIEAVEKVCLDKFQRLEKVSIYVEVESIGGITLDALLEDLKFAFSKFQRFEKKAVVSHHQWMDKLVAAGDRLFPSIQVKHFTWDDKAAALNWVNQSLTTAGDRR